MSLSRDVVETLQTSAVVAGAATLLYVQCHDVGVDQSPSETNINVQVWGTLSL